jgi:hypothetical protein
MGMKTGDDILVRVNISPPNQTISVKSQLGGYKFPGTSNESVVTSVGKTASVMLTFAVARICRFYFFCPRR